MKNGNHGDEIQTRENSEVTMEMEIGKLQRHEHCRAKPNSKRQNNNCSVGGNEKMREVSAPYTQNDKNNKCSVKRRFWAGIRKPSIALLRIGLHRRTMAWKLN